jgi:NhaP-type Na+/H+ or K+/H+ antiporter
VLDLTFGVVAFSILVQGLTIKPLLKRLRLASDTQSTGDSKGNGTASMAMRRV